MPGRQYRDREKLEIIDKFEAYIRTEPRPFVSSFCSKDDIFIPRETLYNWADESERLAELFKMCKTKQRSRLCEGGLDNEYNAATTRLILSTNHGFVEKVENSGDAKRPEQKRIVLEMSAKDASRAYAEMIKGE